MTPRLLDFWVMTTTGQTALPEILARLDGVLRRHRPEYFEVLAAPVADEAVRAFEKRFGVSLPGPLATLYRWHDGQSDEGSAGLVGGYFFMSFELLSYQYGALPEDAKATPDPGAWWKPSWFPFLDDGEGNLVCLDRDDGTLVFYEHDNATRSPVAPDLASLFSAVTEGFEQRALSNDDDTWQPTGRANEVAWARLCHDRGVSLAGLEFDMD